MKLEQSFEVQAPLQRVWEALIDVERVAPCLPGASVTGKNPDGTYNGEFKVKIGPTSAAYTGKLQMENIDEANHSATMQAAGTDKRGQGGAKATIISSISEAPNGATTVHVDTDYHITGRLARFGRGGMIEEISNRLLGEFASSLQGMLGESGDEAPAGDAAQSEAAQSATTGAVPDDQMTIETPAVQPPPDEPAAPVTEPAAAVVEPAAAGAPVPVDEPAPIEPASAEPSAPAEPAAAEPSAPAEPAPAEPAAAVEPAPAPPSAPSAPAAPVPPPTPPTARPAVEPEPLDALSLVRTVIAKRIKQNPVPVLGALLGFLLAVRLLRRRG
jgi:carbon monoxide dehydrogenase subunit G